MDKAIETLGWVPPQEQVILVDPAMEKTIGRPELSASNPKTAPVSDQLLGESSVVQAQTVLGRPVDSVPLSFSVDLTLGEDLA